MGSRQAGARRGYAQKGKSRRKKASGDSLERTKRGF